MMLCINVCKTPFFSAPVPGWHPFFLQTHLKKLFVKKCLKTGCCPGIQFSYPSPPVMLLVLMLPSAPFDLCLLVIYASTVFMIAYPSYSCLPSSRPSDSVNQVLTFFIPTTLECIFVYILKMQTIGILHCSFQSF